MSLTKVASDMWVDVDEISVVVFRRSHVRPYPVEAILHMKNQEQFAVPLIKETDPDQEASPAVVKHCDGFMQMMFEGASWQPM
jgi:hypothetical protein